MLLLASPRNTLLTIAAAVLLTAFAVHGVGEWWDRRQAIKAATAPLISKVIVTAEMIQDGVEADAERDAIDQAADTAADTFRNDITRGRKNDPDTRARADRPVPASVRDAFRARRLAIERAGCLAGECDPPAPEQDASQR